VDLSPRHEVASLNEVISKAQSDNRTAISGVSTAGSGHDQLMIRSILAAALLLAAAPASAQVVRHGQVRLTELSPAVVHGSGFYARERVTITIRGASSAMQRSVLSSIGGAFTVRFGDAAPAGGCQGITVSAVGARGDRADWKLAPAVCGTLLAP